MARFERLRTAANLMGFDEDAANQLLALAKAKLPMASDDEIEQTAIDSMKQMKQAASVREFRRSIGG